MGLSLKDFGEMQPRDYWAAVAAYVEAEDCRLIYISELFRGVAYKVVTPFLKSRNVKVDSFWPFPWDRKRSRDVERLTGSAELRRQSVRELIKKIKNNGS